MTWHEYSGQDKNGRARTGTLPAGADLAATVET